MDGNFCTVIEIIYHAVGIFSSPISHLYTVQLSSTVRLRTEEEMPEIIISDASELFEDILPDLQPPGPEACQLEQFDRQAGPSAPSELFDQPAGVMCGGTSDTCTGGGGAGSSAGGASCSSVSSGASSASCASVASGFIGANDANAVTGASVITSSTSGKGTSGVSGTTSGSSASGTTTGSGASGTTSGSGASGTASGSSASGTTTGSGASGTSSGSGASGTASGSSASGTASGSGASGTTSGSGASITDSGDGGADSLGSRSGSELDISRPPMSVASSEDLGSGLPAPANTSTAVVVVPSCRRFEKRKRDQREDSLDSTHTASSHQSVRSSSGGLYNNQSDTGSVLSHRFSTISISSNVSSDISFGNASAVSGSSCYLASMSSADFDDRPALASSFSLSEAEENEYLSSQAGRSSTTSPREEGEEEDEGRTEQQPLISERNANNPSDGQEGGKNSKPAVTVTVKKDQLSPPRLDGKTPVLPSSDRPKLRSLFRRSNDGGASTGGRSKSSSYESRKSFQSSAESRSREGGTEEPGAGNSGSNGGSSSNGHPSSNRSSTVISTPRSRIGTGSSLTPATSLEQTTSATCVERCSSSFEDEMRRSLNREDGEEDNNVLASASDSEDSAEAGGSLTHHRYYHVFREGEIDHMIEKYVENLHIIRSYYDHANWCVVAEKVNVWTI